MRPIRDTVALLALALGFSSTAAIGQEVDCSPGSMSSNYGGPLSSGGIALVTPAGDHAVSANVMSGAIGKWTDEENGCSEDSRPPLFNGAVADGNVETWTVRVGRQADFPEVEVSSGACGVAPSGTSRTIYIFTDSHCKAKDWRQIEYLAHELGHAMRLGHTNGDSSCSARLMFPNMNDLDTKANRKHPQAEECTALKEEVDRGGRTGGGDNNGNPDGGNNNGTRPNECELYGTNCPDPCELNPKAPGCSPVVTVCDDTNADGSQNDDTECTTYYFRDVSGGGDFTKIGVGTTNYSIELTERARVDVALTGMSRDFDCKVRTLRGRPDSGTPVPRSRSTPRYSLCTNNWGTNNDSWSRTLDAGLHHVQVYPYPRGTGNYTVSITATNLNPPQPDPPTTTPPPDPDPDPDPDPPETPPAAPSLSGSVSGATQTLSWTVPPSSSAITSYRLEYRTCATCSFRTHTTIRSGTSWSTTTGAGVYRGYRVRAVSSAGQGAWSNVVELTSGTLTPAAVSLSGSVSGRTQTLTWTAPAGGGITRYQLQTRNSAAHRWRFTGAGVPSPSSNIGSTVRSWSVVTPWTLVRHYRVRATNAAGDGAWSNVVELTTPAAPPPLSVPGISNLREPSGGTVNMTLPAASGGTPPYTYTLTGLPAGITFNASTRVASGTLPTVSATTNHSVTYAATDSAGMRRSVVFTITILRPPPPPPPPSAPVLSGSVVRQTQSLSWTAPSSASPITRYQMQTRNSAAHSWRFTTAGSPSPSSSFSSSARSWSVTTPARLHRHYRVRATSANGDGAWSNVVELTSN